MLTGGMGGMGGAQPLAATMNEGAILVVEVDPRADRAAASSTGYCDRMTADLDEALALGAGAPREPRARRSRWGWWATAPRCSRSSCGAA